MKKYPHYEVCMYSFGHDEEGNHVPADSSTPPLPIKGWTVYVRGYLTNPIDDDAWDELHDSDFDSEEAAIKQANDWCSQYDCGIDRY
jgi:hypothetical protein